MNPIPNVYALMLIVLRARALVRASLSDMAA